MTSAKWVVPNRPILDSFKSPCLRSLCCLLFRRIVTADARRGNRSARALERKILFLHLSGAADWLNNSFMVTALTRAVNFLAARGPGDTARSPSARGYSCPQQPPKVSVSRICGRSSAKHLAPDRNVRAPPTMTRAGQGQFTKERGRPRPRVPCVTPRGISRCCNWRHADRGVRAPFQAFMNCPVRSNSTTS